MAIGIHNPRLQSVAPGMRGRSRYEVTPAASIVYFCKATQKARSLRLTLLAHRNTSGSGGKKRKCVGIEGLFELG
jgi:hypothetical protein